MHVLFTCSASLSYLSFGVRKLNKDYTNEMNGLDHLDSITCIIRIPMHCYVLCP